MLNRVIIIVVGFFRMGGVLLDIMKRDLKFSLYLFRGIVKCFYYLKDYYEL